MKITRDIRQEVEKFEVVRMEAEAGMAGKSAEFLEKGGNLYVDAAE